MRTTRADALATDPATPSIRAQAGESAWEDFRKAFETVLKIDALHAEAEASYDRQESLAAERFEQEAEDTILGEWHLISRAIEYAELMLNAAPAPKDSAPGTLKASESERLVPQSTFDEMVRALEIALDAMEHGGGCVFQHEIEAIRTILSKTGSAS